ncbi:aldehyde dehydrogenase family protein [Neobacillus sp. NRS-1170]|uniref:aldehyde dehydrogenase family protein n=1 Tax=Neobacillus sp. NRS-1170 TaxID=3233898 RepID=UPI003D2C4F39
MLTTKIAIKESYGHFINGEWTNPVNNQYFDEYNPSTGEKIASFARGDQEDINRAVQNAEEGFKAWYALEPYQRGQIMMNVASLLRKHKADFVYMESVDVGKPLYLAELELEMCARAFEYCAGAADKIFGEVIPGSARQLSYSVREPYGVTAHITPWNSPLLVGTRGCASALAAGNSVVIKVAENTSLSTLEFAALCIEAGVPSAVVNVVTGYGREAGAALVNHPKIRKICFTGSVQTGTSIMKAAAERIVPVTLELGGKSPNIIFEDADLRSATAGAIQAFIVNTGQVCAGGTRLLVQRSIVDTFTERLAEGLKQVTIGNGVENPTIGPVVSEKQLSRIEHYVKLGQEEGAELVCGGNRLTNGKLRNGFFIEPTIFKNVTSSMTIAKEEIFGPVLSIIPFDTEEEAMDLANDTEYGLAAAIWTSNIKRAHRVVKQIQAGQVYINDYLPSGAEGRPFGGYKKSGIGREGGMAGIYGFTQTKTVTIKC